METVDLLYSLSASLSELLADEPQIGQLIFGTKMGGVLTKFQTAQKFMQTIICRAAILIGNVVCEVCKRYELNFGMAIPKGRLRRG